MKPIEEIINKESYSRLNCALVDRVIEIAKKLKEACFKLDLESCDSFKLAGLTFQLRKVKSNSGYSQWNLYMYSERDFVAIDESQSYYYCNDYNCYVKVSNNTEKLYFLQHAKQIFEEIEQIFQDKEKEIEKSIEETKSL